MSLLALQLPTRERLGARESAGDTSTGLRLPSEWTFVFSADGRSPGPLSQSPAGLLPKADTVVLVLAPADISWHRVLIPKAAPVRMRAALAGVLEDALLDTDEATHLALAASATPGKTGWVAATHGPRLVAALAALETAGIGVDRVVAASEPSAEGMARGHFFTPSGAEKGADTEDTTPWLALARDDGVLCLRLAGALSRALQPPAGVAVRWSATPSAAIAAEKWLGGAVPLQTEAEHLFESANAGSNSAATSTNLRQFDLAVRHRGTRALRDAAKRFFSQEWRPVRWGLAALLALQVIGLNAYAWQQRQVLQSKRGALDSLLRAAHPQVRTILDAPAQMLGETERLRATAGRVGAADFEALLGAAAAAWPDGQAPVQTLRFESGRLTLAAPSWADGQITAFRERLKAAGYQVENAEGRLSVSPLAPNLASPGAARNGTAGS
jgi:general secretion pathway protein L